MKPLARFGFEPRDIEEINDSDLMWLKSLSQQTAGTLCINDLYCREDVLKAAENGTIQNAINIGEKSLYEIYGKLGYSAAASM